MNKWLIQFGDNKSKITIYDNGKVYGSERGYVIGLLSEKALNEIEEYINTNIYYFKKLKYYNGHVNNMLLKIHDNSRKHRIIKIVGIKEFDYLYKIIRQSIKVI
jgi:hypothetical protein